MCYNAPISFLTFFVGMYIAYEIWNRPKDKAFHKNYDYWNALFIVSFIFVQLGEGFIWLGYEIFRYFLVFIVALQPIVQSFGNAYFNGKSIFYIPVIIGLLFLFILRAPKNIGKGMNGHLDWGIEHIHVYFIILYGIYYFTFMCLPLLWQVPHKRFLVLFIYGVTTCLWSFYNYNYSGEFSSMWCYLAMGYAFLAYIVNMKSIEKEPIDK